MSEAFEIQQLELDRSLRGGCAPAGVSQTFRSCWVKSERHSPLWCLVVAGWAIRYWAIQCLAFQCSQVRCSAALDCDVPRGHYPCTSSAIAHSVLRLAKQIGHVQGTIIASLVTRLDLHRALFGSVLHVEFGDGDRLLAIASHPLGQCLDGNWNFFWPRIPSKLAKLLVESES